MQIYNVNDFPSTFLTADILVILQKKILLIQRLKEPFQKCWALPGGFFDVATDFDIKAAAVRELYEETNLRIDKAQLELIGLFSKKNRDPRESIATKPCRIVSAAYLHNAIEIGAIKAKDDAVALKWFDLRSLPNLAFDQNEIIDSARQLGKLNF